MYMATYAQRSTHVIFDGLEREGIVDSVLASPFESSLELLDAGGRIPL